ncbi:MAG: hypothetical protein A3F10_04280 [Coxiella sp. RIFCSPHIGHO2_12_FULL_42_15]|nr:MAG: hypothetical protein A3F10_04280 [Coxiella sp. RIFCSPHIGHO2_12_FULL_42_15]
MGLYRWCIVSFTLISCLKLAFAGKVEMHTNPFKFYVETDMGQQNIHANTQSTVVNNVVFMPSDRKDLMERVAFGYLVVPFLGVEAGATFFSGYAYKLAPLESNINHTLLSFEFLLKGILNYKSLHVFVMGGPALVYSSVGGFHVSSGQFSGEFGEVLEIDAHWPTAYFVRPEARVGISADVTDQIQLGAVYGMIFGIGCFQTSIGIGQGDQPELIVNHQYLPTMQYLAAVVTFLF